MRLLFTFLIILGIQSSLFAESTARAQRGFSCTEYCTKGGTANGMTNESYFKVALPRLASGFGQRGGIVSQDLIDFNKYCSKSQASQKANYHGCRENCLQAGGLKSRILFRRSSVESYIAFMERLCQDAKEKMLKTDLVSEKEDQLEAKAK